MILVSIFVFAFLWSYLRKFLGTLSKEKMIIAVTVLSVFISFLVSLLTVYGFQGCPPYIYKAYDRSVARLYNSILAWLSLPFYPEVDFGTTIIETWVVYIRIFFAGAQLFSIRFDSSPMNLGYTYTLFYELLFVFTALNMIGAPIGASVAALYTNRKRKMEERQNRLTTPP